MRSITGRCHVCDVRYTWQAPPMRKNALCPRCHSPLYMTTHLWSGENSTEHPQYEDKEAK